MDSAAQRVRHIIAGIGKGIFEDDTCQGRGRRQQQRGKQPGARDLRESHLIPDILADSIHGGQGKLPAEDFDGQRLLRKLQAPVLAHDLQRRSLFSHTGKFIVAVTGDSATARSLKNGFPQVVLQIDATNRGRNATARLPGRYQYRLPAKTVVPPVFVMPVTAGLPW